MEGQSVKIIPLGGLGEIGKNITAIMYKDEIMVIDCGLAFPDEEMYGVDLVIPDISFLLENKEKVKGIFLTHGHEDHIGSLPYILKQLNVPVYGSKLTLGIVKTKLEEHNILDDCKLVSVEAGEVVKLSHIYVEFIRNTHSIADSCSLAIHTPLGIILHTGDFKIDYTPIDGKVMDLERISALGKKGVLLLMADSTNVERSGHSISEKTIGDTFEKIFAKAEGRVIVATFASNIHRMQQIVDSSIKYNRKVAFVGRSMENVSKVARELGYLDIPETTAITADELNNYPNEQITIITTGSQGEPMASLSRLAFGSHRKLKIEPKDLYIVSASPIPGNEKFISKVINELFRKGADVVYDDIEEVHVSGHGYQEEIKLIHTLARPRYFLPVHGEYRHLKRHGELALNLGMDKSQVFIIETGEVLEITDKGAMKAGRVPAGIVLVDGIGVGDVGNIVLRDRKSLAQDGMFTIVVTIERESCSIIAGPDVITRGFIYAKESEDLISEAKKVAKAQLEKCLSEGLLEWSILKNKIKKSLEKLLYEKTKRRPTIIPIIMEI